MSVGVMMIKMVRHTHTHTTRYVGDKQDGEAQEEEEEEIFFCIGC